MKSGDSFLIVVCHYFHQLGQRLFFSIRWEIFHSQCMILNISSKGYTIEFIANFSLRILIMSSPWDLFGLRFLMVFAISSLVNETVERRLFVLLNNSVESLLILSISVHCLGTFLAKRSSFRESSFVLTQENYRKLQRTVNSFMTEAVI